MAAHQGGGGGILLFRAETEWYNEVLLGGGVVVRWLPHPLQSWLRNSVGTYLLYFITGFLWCFVIYYWRRQACFPHDSIPTIEAMKKQIIVASKAIPLYAALPTITEYMTESGWTRCFFHISDVGWPMYLVYLALYVTFLEFGIYWVHRGLHDIKPLYKHLHSIHHIYNKENTLSPFAGLAFDPLDGLLTAIPHMFAPFLLPMHFRTNIALLFLEGVWTANIHSNVHSNVWPVMGAGYHTIHHTTYKHNYGHYTVFMDWLFGTIREPEDIFKKD